MRIKCKVCESEFPPMIEKHYVSRDEGRVGPFANLNKAEEKIYDTYDCPVCGCQVVVQERKRVFCQEEEDVCLEEQLEEEEENEL